MSAFGTKKPGANQIQELTFPAVFAEDAYRRNMPEAYLPQTSAYFGEAYVGTGLQADYHHQKMLDANRMANAKVLATLSSRNYYLQSNNGYILPKPVLSQRIYANPSNGNNSDIYAARYDQFRSATGSGLEGGVLRTRQGQEYGKTKLRDRISQLNAISAAKAEFQGMMPPGAEGMIPGAVPTSEAVSETAISQGLPTAAPLRSQIELATELDNFADTVADGRWASAAPSAFRLLQLLLRAGATEPRETLEEYYAIVANTANTLRQTVVGNQDTFGDYEEGDDVDSNAVALEEHRTRVQQIGDLAFKMADYLEAMLAVVNKSPKERKAASAAFGRVFAKLRVKYQRNPTADEARRGMRYADPEGDDLPPRPPGRDEFPITKPPRILYPQSGINPEGAFNNPARPPNSVNAALSRANFDPRPREAFGARQGAYFGEDFGESAPAPAPGYNDPDSDTKYEETPRLARSSTQLRTNQLPVALARRGDEEPTFSSARAENLATYDEDAYFSSNSASSSSFPAPVQRSSRPRPFSEESQAAQARAEAELNEGYSMRPRSTMLPPGASEVGAVEERFGIQPSYVLSSSSPSSFGISLLPTLPNVPLPPRGFSPSLPPIPTPTRGFSQRQTLESASTPPSVVAPQLGRPIFKTQASKTSSKPKPKEDKEGKEGKGRQKSLRAKLAEPPIGKGNVFGRPARVAPAPIHEAPRIVVEDLSPLEKLEADIPLDASEIRQLSHTPGVNSLSLAQFGYMMNRQGRLVNKETADKWFSGLSASQKEALARQRAAAQRRGRGKQGGMESSNSAASSAAKKDEYDSEEERRMAEVFRKAKAKKEEEDKAKGKKVRPSAAAPKRARGRPRSTTFHSEEEALAPPSNSAAAPAPKKTIEHPLIIRHKGRPLTAVAENPPPPAKPAPKPRFNTSSHIKKPFIGHGLTRASLPKSREEYETLAEELRGQGHKIRINKNSTIANIRKNFIKKFSL